MGAIRSARLDSCYTMQHIHATVFEKSCDIMFCMLILTLMREPRDEKVRQTALSLYDDGPFKGKPSKVAKLCDIHRATLWRWVRERARSQKETA